MSIQAQSVTQIINQIKNTLEINFRAIFVLGEISNLSSSAAGHWYFNLSDGQSSISCALFKMDAMRNPLIKKLKDGDQIYITGPISVYGRRGTFQLLAKKIMPAGKGNLLAQYEMLKEKLRIEGLFDIDNKKQIPKYPVKMAVITALSAAALQDFLNVIKRRSLWSEVVIVPAVVQGESSAASLRKAYARAQNIKGVDVIVLTRGGGAMEDLWSFNDEKLVRDIFTSSIPTINAVGHQIDYTLCDYVADLRCETPTAAAEILSQAQTELKQRLSYTGHKLKHLLFEQHTKIERKIKKLNPLNQLHLINQRIYTSKEKLIRNKIDHRVHELLPIVDYQMRLDEYAMGMQRSVSALFQKEAHRVDICSNMLQSLNPNNVLKRGYSIVKDSKNNVITNVEKFNKIKAPETLTLQFVDGATQVKKES